MQNDTTLRLVPLMRKSQDTYILKTCSFEAKEVGSGSRGDHFGWWNPSCPLARPLPHPTECSLWCDHPSCSLWHGHSISKDMNQSSNSGDHVIWLLYSWQFPDKSLKRHHTRAPAPWSWKINWKEEWVDENFYLEATRLCTVMSQASARVTAACCLVFIVTLTLTKVT